MKDGGGESANAAGEKHVTELRNSRVGQNFLDVVLRQADGGGEQRRGGADDGHQEHRERRVGVNRGTAHHHVNSRRNHRGCVDQSRHRSRAGHSVGQPNEQRNLRALSGGADEEKNRNRSDSTGIYLIERERVGLCAGNQLKRTHHALVRLCEEADRPRHEKDEQDSEHKSPVAHTISNEGFLRRRRRFVAVKVVTD